MTRRFYSDQLHGRVSGQNSKGPTRAGQPIAAKDASRKPATVNSKRIGGAQRSAQARQQKRRDSR